MHVVQLRPEHSHQRWYERFNTKIDVGSAIGVTRQHHLLLEHVAAEAGTVKFDDLSTDDQEDVRAKAEERYLSYVFLRQSGKQHNKLKVDLQNDFTTGDDRHPKSPVYPPSPRQVQQEHNCEHNDALRRDGICSKE